MTTLGLHLALVDDEDLARQRLRRLLGQVAPEHRVADFANADDFLHDHGRLPFDAVFLDIDLPGRDGLTLARDLGTDKTAIIFATAYHHHAVQAFELAAYDYLLKPFDAARLQLALQRLHERRVLLASASGHGVPRRLAVPHGQEMRVIDTDEILCVRAQGNYVEIDCGGATYLLRATLQHLADRLPAGEFLRVHRSSLVRLCAVKSVNAGENGEFRLVLSDGKMLPVARSYKESVRRAFAF